MKPCKNNFCGGNFQDWLEVMLLSECNGKCSWCVEKQGWHPTHHAPEKELVAAILNTKKTNIILLGGEPLLYPDLLVLIYDLSCYRKNIYLTTNGSLLTPQLASQLGRMGLTGINISIHDYDLDRNTKITGVKVYFSLLKEIGGLFRKSGISVRLNCNCIAGHIDTEDEIRKYIKWAKSLGVNSVRFAELKFDEENFVALDKICKKKWGLNSDPFRNGCCKDVTIDGMHVNFRQMCGLQTSLRPKPENPKLAVKEVLYYDGKLYKGWQLKKDKEMPKPKNNLTSRATKKTAIRLILEKVASNVLTPEEGECLIHAQIKAAVDGDIVPTGGGCVY